MEILLNIIMLAVGIFLVFIFPGFILVRKLRFAAHPDLSFYVLSVIFSIMLSPLLLYYPFKFLEWSVLNLFIVYLSFCLILCLVPFKRAEGEGLFSISLEKKEKRSFLICLGVLFFIIVIPYIEFAFGGDFFQCSIGDWDGREGVIWSIVNNGLPLKDPFFYPGKEMAMYYPFSFYLMPAAVSMISQGISINFIWAVAIFLVSGSLYYVCLDLCYRFFGVKPVWGIFILLFLIGGFDFLVVIFKNVSNHLSGDGAYVVRHIDAWASANLIRIDNIYAAAIWVIPHLGAVLLFLMVAEIGVLTLNKPWRILLVSVLGVEIFAFSPYVFVGCLVSICIVFLYFAFKESKKIDLILSYLISGIVFVLLLLPYYIDLGRADMSGGKAKLIFGIQEINIKFFSKIISSNAFFQILDLGIYYLIELGPFLLTGGMGLYFLVKKREINFRSSLLVTSAGMCLLLPIFIRSTGMYNDFGMRVVLISQVVLAILSGWFFSGSIRISKKVRFLIVGVLLVGFLSCFWEFAFEGLARFVIKYPLDRYNFYSACKYIEQESDKSTVLAIDPGCHKPEMARRLSSRQAMFGGKLAGSFAYTDQRLLEITEEMNNNFFSMPSEISLSEQIKGSGVNYILDKKSNGEQEFYGFEKVYENEDYQVLKLTDH